MNVRAGEEAARAGRPRIIAQFPFFLDALALVVRSSNANHVIILSLPNSSARPRHTTGRRSVKVPADHSGRTATAIMLQQQVSLLSFVPCRQIPSSSSASPFLPPPSRFFFFVEVFPVVDPSSAAIGTNETLSSPPPAPPAGRRRRGGHCCSIILVRTRMVLLLLHGASSSSSSSSSPSSFLFCWRYYWRRLRGGPTSLITC